MRLGNNQRAEWIDGALYPDTKPPWKIEDSAGRVDFLARICAAWDFGILPDIESVAEIRGAHWRGAVDDCRLLTSSAYHLLRSWHNLPPLPYLGRQLAYIRDDPNLAFV